MRLIDLSQPIFDACPNCPAHPPVRSEVVADHPTDGWRLEMLTLASHTGSHVDAPLHKIAGGADLDSTPLVRFTGRAFVADLRDSRPDDVIDAARLAARLPADVADAYVLLNSGWGRRRERSEEWLHHSPRLNPSGASWLVERRARGVGIDHFSIGGMVAENDRTHEILLGAGILIVEELRFPDELMSMPMPVDFMALPVNLRGHSGAWCRPVVVVR